MISTTVTAFPRIHIGLLDIGHATYRKYGGAGMMLNWPVNTVTAQTSSSDELLGLESLDQSAQRDISAAISRLKKEYDLPPLHLKINHFAPQHVGLGSKTALILATIIAAATACDLTVPDADIQRLSARGGVSGIGLYGFFLGGLLVDAGHPQDGLPHLPSSSLTPQNLPLLQLRVALDIRWVFFLVLPKGRTYSNESEVELFRDHTPVDTTETLTAVALMYHGIIPALIGNDLALLRRALSDFRQVGFKRRELEAQNTSTLCALAALEALDECAVGMSSVGPLLYVATNAPAERIRPAIEAACNRVGAELLAVCGPTNSGYFVHKATSACLP